jgi:hypothetical protein
VQALVFSLLGMHALVFAFSRLPALVLPFGTDRRYRQKRYSQSHGNGMQNTFLHL